MLLNADQDSSESALNIQTSSVINYEKASPKKKEMQFVKLKPPAVDDIIGGFYDPDELPESERISRMQKKYSHAIGKSSL